MIKTINDIAQSVLHLPLTQPVAIFLLVLAIILIAPLLFRPLKIPNIVGLILAGVLVGPYGLNLLARDASFEIFGQVGILYLMFMAAIEIDMYHLRKNYRAGLFFGLITFLIPMGIGLPATHWLLDTGWLTALLISSMYASHTLVSYPIVSKFGLSNNRGAVVAVCGTIVAVLLALITLAEVVTVRTTGRFDARSLLMLGVMTVLYAGVVGWSFPWITRWFFRKINDGVSQFIFILALVFVASLFAKLIGLESILGAFFAGLVLNRFIPVRSQLMRRISFVGNALFIPYFLIGVGMLINVNVIFRGWNIAWVAGVMTAVALVSKFVSVSLAGKICHIGLLERKMMFGLSSGKAAATIAATMIGYQYGLLSEDMMNGAVVMIMICCIVASIVTERAAIKIRMELTAGELRNDISPAGFARQLIAVANPITAEGITRMAIYMRSPLNQEAATLLFVRSNDDSRVTAMGREALSKAVAVADSMEIPVREVERFDLNVMAGVTNVMREWHSSEVIIGLHRKSNIVDSFFGSLIEQLMKTTDRMIVMSRCFIPVDTIRRLIVAVPRNAEYETGFPMWVARIGNFASALSLRCIFLTYPETAEYVESLISQGGYGFIRTYSQMESWDDFIILSSQVAEDDLLTVISARKGSISCSSDLVDNMPGFLAKHFTRHNLALIVPAQFGEK